MTFQLWPAIDLINGRPVRLQRGDFDRQTVYEQSLEELAALFSRFATGIHVVDLMGAKAGKVLEIGSIRQIVAASSVPVEVGGGFRTLSDLEQVFDLGVARAILGTAAVKDPVLLARALDRYGPERIVVGVDVKAGQVAIDAWEKSSGLSTDAFLARLAKTALRTLIVTDVARDGTLEGSETAIYADLPERYPHFRFIASGGVSCLADLKALEARGFTGAVFGKALYEGHLSVETLTDYVTDQSC